MYISYLYSFIFKLKKKHIHPKRPGLAIRATGRRPVHPFPVLAPLTSNQIILDLMKLKIMQDVMLFVGYNKSV
jgi:hypothetical protein